jgi:hypothetical protein
MIRRAHHPMMMLGLCLVASTDAPQATSLAPMPSMIMRVVSEESGKAPRSVLIDITLRNPTGWDLAILVSSRVPARDGGGIFVFEQHCLAEGCHGRYIGSGGFYGFWLAAGATLTVRNLEVIWWHDDAVSLHDIRVRAAEQLLLGSEDARKQFTRDPMVTGELELDMDIRVANTAWKMPGDVEVPVLLLGELPVNFDSHSR